MIPRHIFTENKRPPTVEFKLPERDERLEDTPQLAYCLGLLQTWRSSPDSILKPLTLSWLKNLDADEDEVERLKTLATDVVTTFAFNGEYDIKFIPEVVHLAPILEKPVYRYLLGQLYGSIEQSSIMDPRQVDGLAQIIQRASPDYLEATDLVKILALCNNISKLPLEQEQLLYELVLAVSRALDAMADTSVRGLNQEELHGHLSEYLKSLKAKSKPYLLYQAAYAYQASQHISDYETIWQTVLKRNGGATPRQFKTTDTVKALDLNRFIEQLKNLDSGSFDDVEVSSEEVGKQTLRDRLQEGRSFECKQAWYPALRMADALLRDGRFAEFKTLICGISCRKDPAFQWGLCQSLTDLAVHPKWDTETRLNAVALLVEMYLRDEVWEGRDDIVQRILNIFSQLSSRIEPVKQVADKITQHLRANGETNGEANEDTTNQHIYKVFRGNNPETSLLDRVQDTPGVEGRLRQLRKKRLKERRDGVHVNIQAKASFDASGHGYFSLMDKAKEFLSSDHTMFLVLGVSGSGKSTFIYELEYGLWQSYRRISGRIPLYIDLATVDQPNDDLVTKQLRQTGFSEQQIQESKQDRKFILICDGYDQLQQRDNLYTSNRLNQTREWNVKMVICSRSENLGANYLDYFRPDDQDSQPQPELFQQAVIAPFSAFQSQDYIEQYVSMHRPSWDTDDFLKALEQNPFLKDLVRNPLLLSLFLEVMPRMMWSGQRLPDKKFTRVEVYDEIVEYWFERSKDRFENRFEEVEQSQEKEAFKELISDGFVFSGIHYLKKLAAAIYMKQDGISAIEYSRLKDKGTWKEEFFRQDEKSQLLREASPLKCSGNKYQFIHPSVLEYGLALAIFDPQEVSKIAAPKLTSRRGSMDSVMSFEMKAPVERDAPPDEHSSGHISPLRERTFVNDPSILSFLEDRVQQEPLFKQQLLALIELSKTDKKGRVAAANAITILVGAGVQFYGEDLRGIQVPGADLSYGMFETAQLQGADLRKTILRNVWLHKADLSKAQMKGAQFGELPFLIEENVVRSCAYSPDGRYFATGFDSGVITLYTAPNWERVAILSGHLQSVTNVVFTTRGMLVSSSTDTTIQLWDVETRTAIKSLNGHTGGVNSAASSPAGDQVASCGDDRTILLWNVESGECRCVLSGHEEAVLSVVFSPTGNQVATTSSDKTVRLWNVETGDCYSVFSGHHGKVNTAAYSPRGHLVVSGSDDESIRLWDTEMRACRNTLHGHAGCVMSVAFSPLGDTIASGGSDESVRLWDVETGACQYVLPGYHGSVRSIAFSPNGDQIASGCGDKTVRFWDVKNGVSHHVPSGHVGSVRSVAISTKDNRVASGGTDRIIRLWDFESGECLNILRGHKGCVTGVAFSPSGTLIASGSSDQTVRLWDAGTGVCMQILSGHEDEITSVAFSPNGDQVASGSHDQTGRVWNVETGTCDMILSDPDGPVMSVTFSSSGYQVASGSFGKIRVWDAKSKDHKKLDGHHSWILSLMYSPKGDQVVSASYDNSIRLWSMGNGSCRHTMNGHSAPVTSAVYSSRGDIIASSSNDKTVRLWDSASGQCRVVIERFQGSVDSLAWTTRSGLEYLVTGESNGLVRLWRVNEDGAQFNVRLAWSSTPSQLSLGGVYMRDVQGLSSVNRELLKQRGAVIEPIQ